MNFNRVRSTSFKTSKHCADVLDVGQQTVRAGMIHDSDPVAVDRKIVVEVLLLGGSLATNVGSMALASAILPDLALK